LKAPVLALGHLARLGVTRRHELQPEGVVEPLVKESAVQVQQDVGDILEGYYHLWLPPLLADLSLGEYIFLYRMAVRQGLRLHARALDDYCEAPGAGGGGHAPPCKLLLAPARQSPVYPDAQGRFLSPGQGVVVYGEHVVAGYEVYGYGVVVVRVTLAGYGVEDLFAQDDLGLVALAGDLDHDLDRPVRVRPYAHGAWGGVVAYDEAYVSYLHTAFAVVEAHVVASGLKRGGEADFPAGPAPKELEHGGVLAVELLIPMGEGGGDYARPRVGVEVRGHAEPYGYLVAGGVFLSPEREAGASSRACRLHHEGVAGLYTVAPVWPVVVRAGLVPARRKPVELHLAASAALGVVVLSVGILRSESAHYGYPVLRIAGHAGVVDGYELVSRVHVLAGSEGCCALEGSGRRHYLCLLPGVQALESADQGDEYGYHRHCRDHVACKPHHGPLEPGPAAGRVRGVQALHTGHVPVHGRYVEDHEGEADQRADKRHGACEQVHDPDDDELEEHVPAVPAHVLFALQESAHAARVLSKDHVGGEGEPCQEDEARDNEEQEPSEDYEALEHHDPDEGEGLAEGRGYGAADAERLVRGRGEHGAHGNYGYGDDGYQVEPGHGGYCYEIGVCGEQWHYEHGGEYGHDYGRYIEDVQDYEGEPALFEYLPGALEEILKLHGLACFGRSCGGQTGPGRGPWRLHVLACLLALEVIGVSPEVQPAFHAERTQGLLGLAVGAAHVAPFTPGAFLSRMLGVGLEVQPAGGASTTSAASGAFGLLGLAARACDIVGHGYNFLLKGLFMEARLSYVRLGHVAAHHAVGVEVVSVLAYGVLHHACPYVPVVVVYGNDVLFELAVEVLCVLLVGVLVQGDLGGRAPDGPSGIALDVPLDPPPVEHAEVHHTVMGGLHARGAGGLVGSLWLNHLLLDN
ncbi:hypothetical protein LCGC14_0845110, partial [marine sediment metagenome]